MVLIIECVLLFFLQIFILFSFLHLSHIAAECTSTTMCWNCKEPGHLASECPNDPVCHMCGKMGHLARDCFHPSLPTYDSRLCNNCYKAGHIAAHCTNEKACNNCRKTGHLARDCSNEPVCNLCYISGHVARQCPKGSLPEPEMFGGPFRDIICHTCGHPGHISRDCVSIMICHNCGGMGHIEYECPSRRLFDRGSRRYYWWVQTAVTIVNRLRLILKKIQTVENFYRIVFKRLLESLSAIFFYSDTCQEILEISVLVFLVYVSRREF